MFYEIFKFLEENVSQQILPTEYHRTQQFENDLKYYKGSDWQQTYKIRESVQKYLNHLYDINESNPLLLIAYVYHLYMGLLSGGQILSKKRKVAGKFMNVFREQKNDDESDIQIGSEITSFADKSILELKNNLKAKIDEFTKDFDDKLRSELIEESKQVFAWNNVVINSVVGVGDQLKKNFQSFLGYLFVASLGLYLLAKILF